MMGGTTRISIGAKALRRMVEDEPAVLEVQRFAAEQVAEAFKRLFVHQTVDEAVKRRIERTMEEHLSARWGSSTKLRGAGQEIVDRVVVAAVNDTLGRLAVDGTLQKATEGAVDRVLEKMVGEALDARLTVLVDKRLRAAFGSK
jgi:hypothetical protein